MTSLLANWKNTLAGLGVILGALADLATAGGHGAISGNLSADVTAILAGVGLIAAKDVDKS